MSARSITGKPEDFFLLWCDQEPRIVNASVQLNPTGRIEQYAVTLRLPNNQVVGFYSNNLEEAKLRITKRLDDWYEQAISDETVKNQMIRAVKLQAEADGIADDMYIKNIIVRLEQM